MGKVYMREKIYYVDFYVDGRRKRHRVGSNKALAETVLKKHQVEVAEGKFLDIKKKQKVKFDDFAAEYLELHSKLKKSYYTDSKIVGLLKRYFGGKYLYEVSTLDIDKFRLHRAMEVSPATVNRALAVLKSMFNKAILWDKVDRNPCRAVKMFKEALRKLLRTSKIYSYCRFKYWNA
jgi:hypothetical protein